MEYSNSKQKFDSPTRDPGRAVCSTLVTALTLLLPSITFFLLLLGGLVHNTRSSLACPDWPLCFGQFFPKMVGGVLVEHSHRLLASGVGLLTLLLVLVLWIERRKQNQPLLRLALVALFLVCVQALLGGITVLYRLPPWISTAHLAVSLVFFATLLLIAVTAQKRNQTWISVRLSRTTVQRIKVVTALVYFQILVGALMRHLGAGLACVEIPLCQGTLLPHGHFALQLHLFHRLLGLITAVAVIGASYSVWHNCQARSVRLLALAAPLLVVAQIAIGLWVIHSFLGVLPTTLHLGCAALLWANLLCLGWIESETSNRTQQFSPQSLQVTT